jgi:hypothetical protein
MQGKKKLIILMIAILLVLLFVNKYYIRAEQFYTFSNYNKRYCPSTSWRDSKSCSSCINAGMCITAEGTKTCSPGNFAGPTFRNDCVIWQYGDSSQYYPNASLTPINKIKSDNPYFQQQRRKPYEWVPTIGN